MAAVPGNKVSGKQNRADVIPEELRSRPQWLTWFLDNAGGKIPNGKSNDASTWKPFNEITLFDRIAYVIDSNDPYVGIDLDSCRHPESGEIKSWAMAIIRKVNSYCEVSPSQTGVKILLRGKKPAGSRCQYPMDEKPTSSKAAQVEIYEHSRFWAMTGEVLPGFELIRDAQNELNEIVEFLSTKCKKEQPKPKGNLEGFDWSVDTTTQTSLIDKARLYVDKAENVNEGGRNNAAFRLAGHLAAFVKGGVRLSEQEIIDLVQSWNKKNSPPLPDEEIVSCVKSGMTKGTPIPDKVIEDEFESVDISQVIDGHNDRIEKQRSIEDDDSLFMVPGFVEDVVQLNLATAPYPNRKLAFAGALSLLSVLVGRRVSFRNLAPNLYVLCLASSGSGKDHSRKINSAILHAANKHGAIAESFSSGEGLEDTVAANPAILFQMDEFSHIIRSIANDRDGRLSAMVERMLRFYTSSGSIYYTRSKSGRLPTPIARPSLSIFATCTPSDFFDAVNPSLLKNGLIARMLVIAKIKRGLANQKAKPIEIPENIIGQVNAMEFLGVTEQNLTTINPICIEMEADDKAYKTMSSFRESMDRLYRKLEAEQNEAGMAVTSRAAEQMTKLSMLYSMSVNHREPKIDVHAVEWAAKFVELQTETMLRLSNDEVAENQFDKIAIKLRSRVAKEKNGVSHSSLLKFSKLRSDDFTKTIGTLIERGEITASEDKTKGRPNRVYFFPSQ